MNIPASLLVFAAAAAALLATAWFSSKASDRRLCRDMKCSTEHLIRARKLKRLIVRRRRWMPGGENLEFRFALARSGAHVVVRAVVILNRHSHHVSIEYFVGALGELESVRAALMACDIPHSSRPCPDPFPSVESTRLVPAN